MQEIEICLDRRGKGLASGGETRYLTPVAGPIFETKKFSGQIFRERNFGRSITAPTTLFPLIGCGVDSYIPELEHL